MNFDFRRLILVFIATIINPILVRHILLVTVCVLSLIVHIYVQPYARPTSNHLESASLAVLCGISIMNLMKATYFESGNVPQVCTNRTQIEAKI